MAPRLGAGIVGHAGGGDAWSDARVERGGAGGADFDARVFGSGDGVVDLVVGFGYDLVRLAADVRIDRSGAEPPDVVDDIRGAGATGWVRDAGVECRVAGRDAGCTGVGEAQCADDSFRLECRARR